MVFDPKRDGYVRVWAPPAIAGLIEAMPIKGDIWPPSERETFVEAVRAILSCLYKDRAPEPPPVSSIETEK